MMTNTKHAHHQEILSILQNLNSKYLEQEGILFAGGTRITLEINEYCSGLIQQDTFLREY